MSDETLLYIIQICNLGLFVLAIVLLWDYGWKLIVGLFLLKFTFNLAEILNKHQKERQE